VEGKRRDFGERCPQQSCYGRWTGLDARARSAWGLGSATSLARLYHRQRRTDLARKVLSPVYGRFTEGFKAPDVAAAKALLENFSTSPATGS